MVEEEPDASEPPYGLVRAWWGASGEGRDEVVVRIASLALDPSRLRVAFEAPLPSGMPYAGVDVSFDPLSDRELAHLGEAAATLGTGLGDRVRIAIAEDVRHGAAPQPIAPRRTGPPLLALAALGEWRASTSSATELALVLSNRGGPCAAEAVVQIEGDAVERGLVEPRSVTLDGLPIRLVGAGSFRRASLGLLALPPDLDLDRGISPRAPEPPCASLKVALQGRAPGRGLLVVRVTSSTPGTSVMCGRSITVER
jgi:hypothetical protein